MIVQGHNKKTFKSSQSFKSRDILRKELETNRVLEPHGPKGG